MPALLFLKCSNRHTYTHLDQIKRSWCYMFRHLLLMCLLTPQFKGLQMQSYSVTIVMLGPTLTLVHILNIDSVAFI